MNLKQKIKNITVDDLMKWDIEKDFKQDVNQKPDEYDKMMIRDCWLDSEDIIDKIKKYIIEEVIKE